ncbi:LOW QUALITY PROTEIN: protein mono-ADP-ribosyltransferase PARP4 [Rhynchonycteris naso]
MTVGVFANCTFCLKVKQLTGQKKKKLQTDIKKNGGNVSLLNPQCIHVILDNADVLSQYQLNFIQKNHIHIANPDFIWESIKEKRLLDIKNCNHNKSLPSTPPPCQEASNSEMKTDKLCLDNDATDIENVVKFTNLHTENVEIPHFSQDFEVAKYNILEKMEPKEGQETAVVELQCSQDSGDPVFLITACFLPASGTEPRKQFSVKKTSADACEYYENYIEELKKQGFLLKESCTPEATQLASEKLQALLLEEVIHSSSLSQEVSDFVEMIWVEALGHLEHTLLESMSRISLNDVSKVEEILLLVKATLKNGETEEQLQKMNEFYRLIPHRGTAIEKVNLRLLAKKEDLCQLIRDMVNVCEFNLSKPNPPFLAKYRALRCKIERVEQNSEEFARLSEKLLQNNHSKSPVDILQIFRIGQVNEATEFLSHLGNVKPLLHGSPVQSFVGILSQGLLLPNVVEDRGVKRTDIGNLRSGIYFSDSLRLVLFIKYSHSGQIDGTRLVVICDVTLGKCMDLHKRDSSLMEAPPGYDSVHGIPETGTSTTDFKDDEFIVYRTNQVKMKYIVKFCLPGDEVKDFHPCNTTELEEYIPEVSDYSKVEEYQLPDTKFFDSIKAAQETSGNLLPLEDLHIKGKIIDFVAQVIVFQTYTNQSHVPIEAKYIFPLDDKAAVCGLSIHQKKHIVGEIKEKEALRREYREAISQGHGTYLMDQDVPNVFTVSVGNLPPKAKVLIKITYITDLSIQGTMSVFFMPATIAPWQQDKALNENIQYRIEKICINEMGTKQSFSLSMSIEMPYVIEFISSDTHELKKRLTDCKAVISTVDRSSLDSSGFSLHIGLSDVYLPRIWVEKHPENKACMLVFHPDLSITLPDAAKESEVIICLDCSNSMEGVTFLEAKQIALYALSLVGKKQKINIVKFGSGCKELFSFPKYIMSNNVPAEFITSASPTMGNTDFWKTLRYLSLLPPSRGVRNILLISDGHLQEKGLTLRRLVKRHVQHTRLFSCGVSSTANRHILRTLSQCGTGHFEYFNSKSKHSWKKQIEDQMAQLWPLSYRPVTVRRQQVSAHAPVQALFHGARRLVCSFAPHCTQAILGALIQEKEFPTMVSTTELQKTTGTLIHKLTAALIKDYEDGILHESEANYEMKKQILKSLVIQLSKENSLIIQFTSFVAIEKRCGNESPFSNTPNILELIAKEDVDFLPYMSWQKEHLDTSIPQALSASSEWHEELKLKRLTKKCKSPKLEVLNFEELSLDSHLPEIPLTLSFECEDVERPLDLRQEGWEDEKHQLVVAFTLVVH